MLQGLFNQPLDEQGQAALMAAHPPPEVGAFQLLLRLQEERLRRHVAAPPPPPPASAAAAPSKRKRKRPRRTARHSDDVESQRMTHIAVERNRRRLMNDHLTALRSLMPASFAQRGDQASVVGGAVDFIKELEQLTHSLAAEKRRRFRWEGGAAVDPPPGFFLSPQYTTYTSAEEAADVEATLVQTHVNLKVLTRRRRGQLLRAISTLESLGLTVLHLSVTTLDDAVFLCFNLKVEEECEMSTGDQVAAAAHEIFALAESSG
ncbi:transcription factor bHLH57-like [Wolffia australiana]